jgi:hypothetical protein
MMQRRVARLRHRTRCCAPFSRVRFWANRTLNRHRRMTESGPLSAGGRRRIESVALKYRSGFRRLQIFEQLR